MPPVLGPGLGPGLDAASAKTRTAPEDAARIRQAAETFEALFVEILMQRMRSAQLDEGFFGDGAGASTYEGMFQRFLSERVTAGSPLGIADMLVRQWSGDEDPLGRANQDLARIDRARAGRVYEDAAAAEAQVPGIPTDE